MLVSQPNVTYLGRFTYQLQEVSTPAGEPMYRDLSSKQPLRSPLHRRKRNSHTQPTSDSGWMLLPTFLEPCSAAPASYQNQTPTANPFLASGPTLMLGPSVSQGQTNEEAERRSRTDTFLLLHHNQLQHTRKQRRSGVKENVQLPSKMGVVEATARWNRGQHNRAL